jgi:hypothetical protein
MHFFNQGFPWLVSPVFITIAAEMQAANDIQLEHNRSIIAQKNAEIR